MSKKANPQIRLWPENNKRLSALSKKWPVVGSVNRAANMILAFSLERFEKSSDWLTEPQTMIKEK